MRPKCEQQEARATHNKSLSDQLSETARQSNGYLWRLVPFPFTFFAYPKAGGFAQTPLLNFAVVLGRRQAEEI